MELATKDRPESTQDPEQGALTAAIRTGDDAVHTPLDLYKMVMDQIS